MCAIVPGQVCDDIFRIWDYILTERCQIGSKLRPRFSAVLVVPDTLDNRGEGLSLRFEFLQAEDVISGFSTFSYPVWMNLQR